VERGEKRLVRFVLFGVVVVGFKLNFTLKFRRFQSFIRKEETIVIFCIREKFEQ
jgi:hypothetical protein